LTQIVFILAPGPLADGGTLKELRPLGKRNLLKS